MSPPQFPSPFREQGGVLGALVSQAREAPPHSMAAHRASRSQLLQRVNSSSSARAWIAPAIALVAASLCAVLWPLDGGMPKPSPSPAATVSLEAAKPEVAPLIEGRARGK